MTRHPSRSHRGGSVRTALLVSLALCIGCAGSNGCETTAKKAAARVTSSGSRAVRVLQERCKPRVPGRDPGATSNGASAGPQLLVGERLPASDQCTRHENCKAAPHGRCVAQPERTNDYHGRQFYVPPHNECVYDDCESDAECQERDTSERRTEQMCSCRDDDRNTCVPANCRTDADCPAPHACGAYRYCHSAGDECKKNDDCKGGEQCMYGWETRRYSCITPQAPPPG